MYNLTNRDTSLSLRTPVRSAQFFYKSSVAWNSVYKKVLENPTVGGLTSLFVPLPP